MVVVARDDELTEEGTGFTDIFFEPRISFESKNVKSSDFLTPIGSEKCLMESPS